MKNISCLILFIALGAGSWCQTISYDLSAVPDSIKKNADVVVLDPPKLIYNQQEFDEGRAKYFDMNKLALGAVRPGGMFVTCSCSGLLSMEEFFSVVKGAARGAKRRVQVLRATGPGPDHPVMTECPESSYLKCLWCKVW